MGNHKGPKSTAMMRVVIFCMTLTLGACLIPPTLPAAGSNECFDGCLSGTLTTSDSHADSIVITDMEDCKDYALFECPGASCVAYFDSTLDNSNSENAQCQVFEKSEYDVPGVDSSTANPCVSVYELLD